MVNSPLFCKLIKPSPFKQEVTSYPIEVTTVSITSKLFCMEAVFTTKSTLTEKNLLQTARDLGPIIGAGTDQEENNRRLSAPVIHALKEAGLFKLFLPKALGGLEADPVTTAQVVEEISLHNTAAGWAMMVANTSNWWGRFYNEQGIEELHQRGPDTLVAGVIHPPMKATPVEGGYRINGRCALASNVHEAQWIFVTALVMENDQPKFTNGQPEIIGVTMKQEDCEILDTWYTLGMRATDSNDVVATNVFVPFHLSFPLVPGQQQNKYYTGQLYQIPAICANPASVIPPVALAVARKAINELKALADKKTPLGSLVPIRERAVVQQKLGKAEALVQSSSAFLYQKIDECWRRTLNGENLNLEDKSGIFLAAAHTCQSCVMAVDLMYAAAGSSAIYTRSKLEHCFADIQVIRQHGFTNESRYETAAQVYLGLPPDLPLLVF
jgi:indole-3-acetate monooxygenase